MTIKPFKNSIASAAAILAVALLVTVHTAEAATLSKTLSLPANNLGLVGWWTFDGGDMLSNAVDRSGSGKHGNLVNYTSTTTVSGKVGQALKFNGSNQRISIPEIELNRDFTISAWVRHDSLAGYQGIVSGGAGEWCLLKFDTTNVMSFYECSTGVVVNGATAVSANRWYHVVVTMSAGSTGTATMYLNGVQDGQNTTTRTLNDAADTVIIGASYSSGGDPFNGAIDDVRLYGRALTLAEIQRLYRMGASAQVSRSISGGGLSTGLVGWWTFDGPDMVSNVRDRSGSGYHGALSHSGSGTTTAPGRSGQAIVLDGANDFVTMGDVLDFDRTDPFSVSLWYKSSVSDIPGDVELVSKKDNTGTFPGWGVRIRGDTAGDPLRFNLTNTVTTDEISINYAKPQDTNWHHAVISYAGTGQAAGATAYIDGETVSPTGTIDNLTGSTVTAIPLNIGSLNNGPAVFSGSIDDVRVYNKALSSDQARSLYLMGR